MTALVTKLQSASCRSWEGLQLSVKEQEKADLNANVFTVEESFSGKYYAFDFLYSLLSLLKYKWHGRDTDTLSNLKVSELL